MIRPRRCFRVIVVAAGMAATLATAARGQRVDTRLPGRGAEPAPARVRGGTIDGIVTDTSLAPVPMAEVYILRGNLRLRTGMNGRFRFLGVPPGSYVMIVRRIGLRPVSSVVNVAPSDTIRLSFALERSVKNLDTVVIAAKRQSIRMAEFEGRRRLGFGEFMTREEIMKNPSVFATELLRRFKTINVSPNYEVGPIPAYYALSRREGGSILGTGGGYCAMQVMLDGFALPTPFDLSQLPSPKELGAIEVYNGPATLPPQFGGGDRRCGMVLIWTRDGY